MRNQKRGDGAPKMDNKMNWADLPIFLAVVESGSLSGAARTLHLSQPTVGRRISALETQVGTPLLNKTSSGLAPTEIGHKILDHIRQMDVEAEAIFRATAADDQTLSGDITISASQGIGDMWLPLALSQLHQQYPEINVIIDVNFEMANLARREADIALRWMGPGNQNSLIGRKVSTVGFGLYASHQYLEKFGRPASIEDLTQHQAVAVQVGEYSPIWPINLDEISVQPAHIPFRSNSFHTHESAIRCGFGLGSLAHVQAIRLPGVERILPEFEHRQDLWIVAHDDLTRNKRIRLVFDFLIQCLTEDQEYFLTGSPSPWDRFPT
jgi:DNA-binding transcriptional LysR family regulator